MRAREILRAGARPNRTELATDRIAAKPSTVRLSAAGAFEGSDIENDGDERPQRCPGQDHSEQPAGARQDQALGQKLAHDAAAAGADRRANRELRLTSRTPGQQQAGDVDTGNQQDQPDGVSERRDGLP